MTEFIQVVTTIAREEEAEVLAKALVEERLAACVQITGPIASVYRWKGQVEAARERQCWVKTRADLYPEVERTIRRLHPYEVPEIIAFAITAGSAEYLQWVDENVGPE